MIKIPPGRPRKYTQKLVGMTVALEPMLIEKLKEDAYSNNLSLNEYVTSLIATADYDYAKTLLNSFKQLQKKLAKYSEDLANSNEQIKDVNRRSIYGYLFEEIKDIPELNKYIDEVKDKVITHKEEVDRYKKGFYKVNEELPMPMSIFIENLTKHIYEQFEMDIIRDGKRIRDKSAIKVIIKSKLLKLT